MTSEGERLLRWRLTPSYLCANKRFRNRRAASATATNARRCFSASTRQNCPPSQLPSTWAPCSDNRCASGIGSRSLRRILSLRRSGKKSFGIKKKPGDPCAVHLTVEFAQTDFRDSASFVLGQWSSTFSLKGSKSRLAALSESRTKEILTQVNWHVLFYCRTKSVTQNIRGFIERLLRAAVRVLGSRTRLSERWLKTTGPEE